MKELHDYEPRLSCLFLAQTEALVYERHWGSFVKRRNWLKRVRIVWPPQSFDPERLWGVSFKLMLVPVPRPLPLILHCTVYPWVSLGETTKTAFIPLGTLLVTSAWRWAPHSDTLTLLPDVKLHAALNLGRFYHNKKPSPPPVLSLFHLWTPLFISDMYLTC